MFPKCLLFASLLVLSYANLAWGEDFETPEPPREYIDGPEDDGTLVEPIDPERLKPVDPSSTRKCDEPECTLIGCEGAGPPPYCPRNLTICRSGCACIVYCKDQERALYCYQVKYCRTPRRFSPDIFTTMKMVFD